MKKQLRKLLKKSKKSHKTRFNKFKISRQLYLTSRFDKHFVFIYILNL